MILLLGSSGYIGSAFADALYERGTTFCTLSHAQCDLTRYDVFSSMLSEIYPDFVINATGYVGSPNVDACEDHKAETLLGNLVIPRTVGLACSSMGIPWGHVSSGCIYNGAKLLGGPHPGLMTTDWLCADDHDDWVRDVEGYTEADTPNFTFRSGPCSFYSGVKALAEEALAEFPHTYIWRTRIPFDNVDHPRNYLSKLQSFPTFFANGNSLSHRGDFVRACLDLVERQAPYGTYNLTNPGWMRSTDIVEAIRLHLRSGRVFRHFASNAEYEATIRTPRSACVLDVRKALATGIKIRPVEDAVEDALSTWKRLT